MLALYHIVQLVGGLALLVYGADVLVKGASRLARAFGISSFVVGLTVVAFGTSAPELGGSLRAVLEDDPGLAIGNVIGSNIANIGLILGVTAVICPIPVKLSVVRKEAIIMIVVTFGAVLLMLGGGASRLEGALLVAALIVFVVQAYRKGKHDGEADSSEASELARAAHELEAEIAGPAKTPIALSVAFVIAGLAMLFFGSGFLVDGASALAAMVGVPSAVIGLSLVAFGTSVPELALSALAALRKEPDIAIGNIVGSNIFNLLCVLGFTALLSPVQLAAPPGFWERDAPVMILLTVACLPIMLIGRRVSRIEGVLLLGLYAGYLGVLFATSR